MILLLPIIAFALPSCSNPITTCGCALDNPSEATYSLANDISSQSGTCLEITTINNALLCNGFTISGSGTGTGIDMKSNGGVITDCNIKNFQFGVDLSADGQYNNVIRSNNISNNFRGIHINGDDTNANTVRDNRITDNNVGIMISAYYNYIYNNFFNNPLNAFDDGSNTWNNARSSGTNIIGGPYKGGNYWSDYTGQDTNGDGIGETSYSISGGSNVDYLPLVDINPPQYSNIVTNPINPTYSPLASYQFNITWTDNIAVDEVIFQFNGVNYSYKNGQVLKNGNVYYITLNDLSANPSGYVYKWYANDTRNNWNSTDTLTYTINKATPTGSLSTSSWNVTYPTPTTVSCSLTSGDPGTFLTLKRDGSTVATGTPPSETITLGYKSGGYSYSCEYPGTQNYSAATLDTHVLTINKTSSSCSLTGVTNHVYGTSDTPVCSCTGDGTTKLYRNEADKTNWNNTAITQEAGDFTWVCNTTGYNYTSNSTTMIQNISKASVPLVLNNNISSWSGTYPISTNTTGSGCPAQITCNLYRNDSSVSNPELILLGAGAYNYTFNTSGNANYSSNSTSSILTINKKDASIGVNPTNQTQTYEDTPLYQYCTGLSTLASCKIYRNGVEIANNTNPRLAAGTYNYVANISDNQNYTSYQATSNLTINPKNAQVTVNPTTQTIVYGASTNQYCTSNTSLVSCKVYRNNAEQTNNSNIILGVGTYTYTANISDSANYTNYSTTSILNVSQATPTCTLSIDPSSPITYGTYHTPVCSCSENEGTVKLYRNNTDVTFQNNTAILLGANTYNYTCNVTSSQNYTSASKSQNYIIIKASRTCNLNTDKNWTRTYDGTPSSTTCSVSAGSNDGSIVFTVNSSSVSTPDLKTDAGTYQYACQWTGGVNYSDCTQTKNLTISKATPSLITSVTSPITYGTASDYSASESNSGDDDCTYKLLRNGTQIANGSSVSDSTVLGVGIWNYTYYTIGCSNYTSNKDEKLLTVNKATPSGSLTVNPSWTVTYPTSVTIGYSESNSGDAGVVYKVWRDGVDKGSGETWTPPTGTYQYKLNTTGGTNFTARDNMDTKTLIVSTKPAANCSLTSSSGWSYTYGTSTTLACSCKGDGTTNLYFNGALHNDYNNSARIFAANQSGYSVVCNITEGTNYASAMNSSTLIIYKAAQSLSVGPLTTVTYGTATQTGCQRTSGDSSSTLTLYRNGTQVATGTTSPINETPIVLGAGTYNYTCTVSETQNYSTALSINNYRTVSKASSSCSLNSFTNHTYGTTDALSCSCIGDGTTHLYRDGILHDEWNNTAVRYGAGSFNWVCNITEGTNYNSASTSKTQAISKAAPSITLTILPSQSVTYPTQTNTSCSISSINNEVTPRLFRNGSQVNNSDVATLPIGSYPYICNNSETQNYTSNEAQKTLVVNAGYPLVITILSPGSTYYTTSIPLTFTVSKPASWCGYSLDGAANKTITGCANTTLVGLSYSTHNIIIYANDTSGNMGKSNRVYFTVKSSGGGGGGGGGGRPMLWTG